MLFSHVLKLTSGTAQEMLKVLGGCTLCPSHKQSCAVVPDGPVLSPHNCPLLDSVYSPQLYATEETYAKSALC